MNASDVDAADEPKNDEPENDEGPGCLPAVLAAGALVLMALFIVCGISTWYLFQQRTELAIRTLRSDVIPEVQQSSLPPDEKTAIIQMLQQVVADGESGQLEDWQASGIMQRLVRSPILEWGTLDAVEAMIAESTEFSEDERGEAQRQLSRVRRAVELKEATAVDIHDVLSPVLHEATPGERQQLNREAEAKALREVVHRAELIADRGNVPDEDFDVELSDIIRREIEAGREVGGL